MLKIMCVKITGKTWDSSFKGITNIYNDQGFMTIVWGISTIIRQKDEI